MSKVAVVIVMVNAREATLAVDCLRSLEGEAVALPGFRVLIADNGSADGAADVLRSAIRAHGWAWADIVRLDSNRGFAAGNNGALRVILTDPDPPDYVHLLNPDTVARPGAVRSLADFLDRHPGVGIAGSRMENLDGSPQASAFRFPSVRSEWESGVRLGLMTRLLRRSIIARQAPERPEPTDWVSGASFMVRRQVFEEIGLLDDGYFVYYEEVDFCRRAADAGWPCWVVPASRVAHLVSSTTGVDGANRARKPLPGYWFAARRRYFAKHHRPLDGFCAHLLWALGFASWRLRRPLQGKPDTDPPRLLRDYVWYNFLQPLIGTGRPRSPARGLSARRPAAAATTVNGSAQAGGSRTATPAAS